MIRPPEQKSQNPYFVEFWIDFLCAGGASILLYFVLRYFHTGERTPFVYQSAAALMWVVNWPHFSATHHRLYSKAENRAQFPLTAFLIPCAVLGGTIASLFSPALVAPYFVKLFLLWSPYHFSGQTLGVSLLYARRTGFAIGRAERLAFSAFIFSSFLYMTARTAAGTGGAPYYGITTPGLGVPSWLASLFGAASVFSAAALLFAYARACVGSRRLIAPIVLVPAAAQYFWFVQGAGLPAYYEFVPFFHSLQYLLIAWALQLKEGIDENPAAPSWALAGTLSARWALINFTGGIFLFWLLPRAFAKGFDAPLFFVTGVVIAGVQIHHFFVDGVIWKLRRKSVSSPLLVNVLELVKPPARA